MATHHTSHVFWKIEELRNSYGQQLAKPDSTAFTTFFETSPLQMDRIMQLCAARFVGETGKAVRFRDKCRRLRKGAAVIVDMRVLHVEEIVNPASAARNSSVYQSLCASVRRQQDQWKKTAKKPHACNPWVCKHLFEQICHRDRTHLATNGRVSLCRTEK